MAVGEQDCVGDQQGVAGFVEPRFSVGQKHYQNDGSGESNMPRIGEDLVSHPPA